MARAPRPASPAAASLAFAWRSLLKIRQVPEQLGDVNPVGHLIPASRALMGGTASAPHELWPSPAAALIAIFAPLAALLYQRK